MIGILHIGDIPWNIVHLLLKLREQMYEALLENHSCIGQYI
jgi:hypothetical protein